MTNDTPTLRITRGLPASGKSGATLEWVAEDENRVRLNRDDTRKAMFGKQHGLSRKQENLITETLLAQARFFLQRGFDVTYDAQNTINKFLKEWISMALATGARIEFVDFDGISLEDLLERNRQRSGHQVPEEYLRDAFQRRTNNGRLNPPPEIDYGRVFKPYVADESLPKAIIVDLDGTLAKNNSGRSFYDMARVEEDDVRKGTLEVISAMHAAGVKVLYFSGRNEAGRDGTLRWLKKHGAPEGEFHMRADDDQRSDDVVKHEMFYNIAAPRFNVVAAFDDRAQVIRMWEKIGLPVFNAGAYDAPEF